MSVSNTFFEPLGKKSHYCRFKISYGYFLFFYTENGILCVLIRIASTRRFLLVHTTCMYLYIIENRKYIPFMPSDLALSLTFIRSNHPCPEHIFMVPKVFEPLKFCCNSCRCLTLSYYFHFLISSKITFLKENLQVVLCRTILS